MSDDQCTEVGGPNGEPLRRCRLTAGHGGGHSDGTLTWLLGFEPTVTPLQERGPEQPVQWCGDGSAPVGGPCSMTLGHEGDHQNGQHIWHQAQGNYRSTNLAGASHDDLIRDLFRRVEQLEQTSAGGAAVDDMFSGVSNALDNHAKKITELRVQVRDLEQLARPTSSCASEELRQGLGEVEKRMTRLEQAQVYGPGPHDLSALQASITNHVNRALTEWGSGFASLLTEQHREMEGLLNRVVAQILGELKPVPPVFCEAPDNTGTLHCEKGPDHDGRHQSGNTSWPNPCKQPHPTLNVTCSTVKGHTTEHRSGPVRWVDGQEQYQDLGTVKDNGADDLVGHPEECHGEVCVKSAPDGAQTERASGSPAAVRCPAQFREGQCLGYAGHDGDCSAVPAPREPQLEDPEEFEHTSYASLDYLNRRGVPDGPEECGNPPAPGSSSPPCGRPAGHTGVCASGPQYSGEDEPGEPGEEDNYPEQNFYS